MQRLAVMPIHPWEQVQKRERETRGIKQGSLLCATSSLYGFLLLSTELRPTSEMIKTENSGKPKEGKAYFATSKFQNSSFSDVLPAEPRTFSTERKNKTKQENQKKGSLLSHHCHHY